MMKKSKSCSAKKLPVIGLSAAWHLFTSELNPPRCRICLTENGKVFRTDWLCFQMPPHDPPRSRCLPYSGVNEPLAAWVVLPSSPDRFSPLAKGGFADSPPILDRNSRFEPDCPGRFFIDQQPPSGRTCSCVIAKRPRNRRHRPVVDDDLAIAVQAQGPIPYLHLRRLVRSKQQLEMIFVHHGPPV
jgi:hypothetical protein